MGLVAAVERRGPTLLAGGGGGLAYRGGENPLRIPRYPRAGHQARCLHSSVRDSAGHDGTIELSKQAIGGSHPGVWSIDPPVAKGSPLQTHKTELDHDAIVMEVPVTRGGKPAGALRFGLVLIGRIEA